MLNATWGDYRRYVSNCSYIPLTEVPFMATTIDDPLPVTQPPAPQHNCLPVCGTMLLYMGVITLKKDEATSTSLPDSTDQPTFI